MTAPHITPFLEGFEGESAGCYTAESYFKYANNLLVVIHVNIMCEMIDILLHLV